MAEINPMKSPTIVAPADVVEQTLDLLKESGRKHAEGVALWLARATNGETAVVEAYKPEHEAEADYFHIPPSAMAALLQHLGKTETFIAAQVHSHPFEAFHSPADDKWAIVRHEGALSIVVPNFAQYTSVDNFSDQVATFKLNRNNIWQELDEAERRTTLRIVR
jgi:proteasome lid subunit RPN8/RPN11